jgi:hypothetical protein
MATSTASVKLWQGVNAVDLVTLAVFAALYRALWYLWHALSFLFPFNQVLSDFFYVLCGIAAVVIVRKWGAATLFAIAAQIVNLFIQGEMLLVALILVTPGILADLYIYFRLKGGHKVFDSYSDMVTSGTLFGIWWSLINWALVFPIIFLTQITVPMAIAAAVACAIGGLIGAMVGFGLGNRIKGLID